MNSTPHPDERLGAAFEWIIRLPMLSDIDLSELLGVHEVDAYHLRVELDARGYSDRIVPRVPGLDDRRDAAFLRLGALKHLSQYCGASADVLARRAPVLPADILARVPRLATVAGINRTLARLAATLRARGAASLVDACSLPLAKGRWGPRLVDAFGVAQSGRNVARFFMAWDRAGATAAHRRRRAEVWAEDSRSTDVILLVAADVPALDQWEVAFRRCSAAGLPAVSMTTADQVFDEGPGAAIWTAPGSATRMTFEQVVRWEAGEAQPLLTLPSTRSLPAYRPETLRLREWAEDAALSSSEYPVRERLAALALVTDAVEKRCIEWLDHHPRLSAPHLAALLDVPLGALLRNLERLERYHAVRPIRVPGIEEVLCESTLRGLRLVDASENRPLRREEVGPANERSLAHDHGVDDMFARFALDARAAGWELGVWESVGASAHHFEHDGRRSWVRPDGSGRLQRGGEQLPFLAEYDRGTLDGGDFAAKFDAYRRYYAERVWRTRFSTEPMLLFVCNDSQAEQRVAAALARSNATHLPVLLTSEWRRAGSTLGFMGDIWTRANSREPRGGLVSLTRKRRQEAARG